MGFREFYFQCHLGTFVYDLLVTVSLMSNDLDKSFGLSSCLLCFLSDKDLCFIICIKSYVTYKLALNSGRYDGFLFYVFI